MDFFGLGPLELILIIVVAFIIFGPGRVVEISRGLGKTVRAFRKATTDLTQQINKEIELEHKEPPPTADTGDQSARTNPPGQASS
ncbi:MAG: twin-arginine translocase TatA/TatE family subunit [Chloroflexota bacterium]